MRQESLLVLLQHLHIPTKPQLQGRLILCRLLPLLINHFKCELNTKESVECFDYVYSLDFRLEKVSNLVPTEDTGILREVLVVDDAVTLANCDLGVGGFLVTALFEVHAEVVTEGAVVLALLQVVGFLG